MEHLLAPGTFEPDALSLPFLIAAAVVAAMTLYVAVMRGAPLLRYAFLGICLSLLPYVGGLALIASCRDPEAQLVLMKLAVAPTALAGASSLWFCLALARKLARYGPLAIAAVVISAGFGVLCAATDLVIGDVYITASGIPFNRNGPLTFVNPTLISLWVGLGVYVLWRTLDGEPSPLRRRQYKGVMWAFSVCALGVSDTLLTYGIGWYPTSWLFLTIGATLALRSIVTDDVIRAAALDRRVFNGAIYVAAAAVAMWVLARALRYDPMAAAVATVGVFLALRAGGATLSFLSRGGGGGDSPLERALDQYTRKVQREREETGVADATREVLHLALGAQRVEVLVPSEDDYSWRVAGGDPLPEDATPDPLVLGWLAERPRPLVRDELVSARLGDLRSALERLFDEHDAEAIVPLTSRDELTGLLIVGALAGGRALKPDELAWLGAMRERTAQGLLYAAMYRQTHARVEVAKEVELAAAVQEAFVPAPAAETYGPLRLCGVYAPATRCGGDWWSARVLSGGRALILIGDVTGHGVAAAMVTAAAKGCYDVALRLMGDGVDLPTLMRELHTAVRRTGGDQFYMTCFASLIDPAEGTVTYANAGHVVPYVCRFDDDGDIKLDVLVARGNPLGASDEPPTYKSHTRPIAAGDVLIWYTDGIVECLDPQGRQFGDRRFQRSLRKLAAEKLDVDTFRDRLLTANFAFRQGRDPDDDITLVIGRYVGLRAG